MQRVAITLDTGADKRLALLACAKSIAEGYGAGTLSVGDDHEFLGFWTSRPETYKPEEIDILVDAGREIDDSYEMAAIVRRKAKEFE